MLKKSQPPSQFYVGSPPLRKLNPPWAVLSIWGGLVGKWNPPMRIWVGLPGGGRVGGVSACKGGPGPARTLANSGVPVVGSRCKNSYLLILPDTIAIPQVAPLASGTTWRAPH